MNIFSRNKKRFCPSEDAITPLGVQKQHLLTEIRIDFERLGGNSWMLFLPKVRREWELARKAICSPIQSLAAISLENGN